MQKTIEVTALSKSFPLPKKEQKNGKKRVQAVDGLNFCAYEGEIFGLLGPNGAGKTTTLRMLSTLIKPESGDATLCGASIVRESQTVRSRIGFLTSELKLEEFFTPNALFDFFSQLHGVEKQTAAQRKEALFARFGIDEFANVKVGNLSTGMKQKTSLAIALVHDPKVIIFDEPTNGLDVITAKTVTDFLLEQKAAGKTIVISTHIFSLIEKVCDRVGVIINGKMVAEDSLANLCQGQSLEDVFFTLYEQEVGHV